MLLCGGKLMSNHNCTIQVLDETADGLCSEHLRDNDEELEIFEFWLWFVTSMWNGLAVGL